ncbi:hypothetical protein MINTM020_01210 [Mycobacterium paraintracellulare]|nr:hypothetical protein MINTM020_01210 [Mycobacterium paraintracellulare]
MQITGTSEFNEAFFNASRAGAGLRTMRSYAVTTRHVEEPVQDKVSKPLCAKWHRELGVLAMDVVGKEGLASPGGISTSGSGFICSPAPTLSIKASTRFNVTSSPGECSACRGRSKDDAYCRTERD